jgi:IS30 family transposase
VKSGISMVEFQEEQSKDANLDLNDPVWGAFKRNGYRMLKDVKVKFIYKNRNDLKLMVPKHLEQRIIKFYHAPEHIGTTKLYQIMHEKYLFPKMMIKISNYVNSCQLCLAYKRRKGPNLSKVKTTTPEHPWTCIQADLIGPLPLSLLGNKYILTVVCCLTRWCELACIPDKTAVAVTTAMMAIFARRGPPLTCQTDCGKEFVNTYFKETLKNCGIHTQTGAPYKPTTQGMVERTNAKIKNRLLIFNSDDLKWDEDVPYIQLLINRK